MRKIILISIDSSLAQAVPTMGVRHKVAAPTPSGTLAKAIGSSVRKSSASCGFDHLRLPSRSRPGARPARRSPGREPAAAM